MTEIKTYCDKCGIELNSHSDYEDIEITVNHYWRKQDLCASCYEKLTGVIEIFFDKSEDEE